MEIVKSNNGELLDMEGASRYLAVKKSTLYQLVMRRQIAVCKVGRLNRFRKADLDKFIESNVKDAVSEIPC